MKRLFHKSPVEGYQIFQYVHKRQDGTEVPVNGFYVRRAGGKEQRLKDVVTLKGAQAKAKEIAADDAGRGKDAAHAARERERYGTTVGDLLDLVVDDYRASGRKTAGETKSRINLGLREFFGDMIAKDVASGDIKKWIEWRRKRRVAKQSPTELTQATINRELALLRRAYKLGAWHEPPLVDRVPPIKMLRVSNARKGFMAPDQYKRLMMELPAYLRSLTCVAYNAANRKGELMRLRWDDVDLDGNPPVFTLWPGTTKNEEGRTLPIFDGEMMEGLRTLKGERDARWPHQQYVFVDGEGNPITHHSMRRDWEQACVRAGLGTLTKIEGRAKPKYKGLLFHDTRRSAIRNMRRAGISEHVAMQISGHKTTSVFRRYEITDYDDLRDAGAKLRRYLDSKDAESSKQQTRPISD